MSDSSSLLSSSLDEFSLESCVGDRHEETYNYAHVLRNSQLDDHDNDVPLRLPLPRPQHCMSTPYSKTKQPQQQQHQLSSSSFASVISSTTSSLSWLPFSLTEDAKPRFSVQLLVDFVTHNYAPCPPLVDWLRHNPLQDAQCAREVACERVASLLHQLSLLHNKLHELPTTLLEGTAPVVVEAQQGMMLLKAQKAFLRRLQCMHYITWQSFYLALSRELDDAACYLRTLLEVPIPEAA